MKTFYRLPNGQSFAFVARAGSTALGCGVQSVYGNWHGDHCCDEELPRNCVVVVREPVTRFRSLLWAMNTTADEAISRMQESPRFPCGRGFAQHFRPVSTLVQSDSRVFRFFDPEIWTALIIPPYNEIVSKSSHHPDLTTEQEEKVRDIYADDIALWESLS
jgi:hypothetical protein